MLRLGASESLRVPVSAVMTGLPEGGDFPLYDARMIFDLLFPLSVPDGNVVRSARVKKWSKMWRGVTILTLAHSSH